MIHYTCDRCNRPIDPANEVRYVVKMEVQAAMEPWDEEQHEADRDHLMEVHEILHRDEEFDDDHVGLEVYRKMRYDVCSECHRNFMKNPIGKQGLGQTRVQQELSFQPRIRREKPLQVSLYARPI